MPKGIFIGLYVLLSVSCKAQQSSMGQVFVKTYIIDEETHQPKTFFSEGRKFWYKDSLIVGEYALTHFIDSFEVHRKEKIVLKYIFLNLATKQFYEYLHFSDTAVLKKAYNEPIDEKDNDLAHLYVHRFQEYLFTDSAISAGKNLPDTTMDGKLYSRFRFTIMFTDGQHPLTPFLTTLYFDCKANNGVIKWFKSFGDKQGCPVVRQDEEFAGNFMFTELTSVSKTLTTEELKAFNAWEKYAKEHPVK